MSVEMKAASCMQWEYNTKIAPWLVMIILTHYLATENMEYIVYLCPG